MKNASWPNSLKHFRKERKLSQTRLGKLVGVSGPTISDWENGHQMPKGANLLALCEVMRITPDALLYGRETTPQGQDTTEVKEKTGLYSATHDTSTALEELDRLTSGVQAEIRQQLIQSTRRPQSQKKKQR